jgi:hypothetical protein
MAYLKLQRLKLNDDKKLLLESAVTEVKSVLYNMNVTT